MGPWPRADFAQAQLLAKQSLGTKPTRHGFTLQALYQAYRAAGDADASAETLA